MTTELDELAALAVNDPSLSRVGLDRLIRSVIDQTRRDWATMSDEHHRHLFGYSAEGKTGND
ncbi:MAG TPA: hypothetical protein VI363_10275 [Burkholderiales bacterium]